MRNAARLIGDRFGWLLVKQRSGSQCGHATWLCECRCGKTAIVTTGNLRNGDCTSCGCKRVLRAKAQLTKHGLARLPEYRIWQGMLTRVRNPNRDNYSRYGGKGVTVCKNWVDSFESFLNDMGPRPSTKHSIDRFPNPAGNYEPSNCRWATSQQQIENKNRRLWVLVGKTRILLSDYARQSGLNYRTLNRQYHNDALVGASRSA